MHRIELDRPILFNEKLDVLWNAQILAEASEEAGTSS